MVNNRARKNDSEKNRKNWFKNITIKIKIPLDKYSEEMDTGYAEDTKNK